MVKKNVCLNRCGVNVACSTRVQLYRGLESRWSQTKDYIINICCFAAENTALRSNSRLVGSTGIGICPNGATCLPAYCCFSKLMFLTIS